MTPISVELLDHMGSDLDVVNAARVSFNKENSVLGPSDERLIRYLVNHAHWTTYAHCSVRFRIKAPIFVARQLVKHQVGAVWNEVSRRYVDDAPEYWLPDHLRVRPEASIKQGSGGEHPDGAFWIKEIREHTLDGIRLYEAMIAANIAPEQARMVLSLNSVTEWWWTGSLAFWARVCALRLDPHAQAETRDVAELVSKAMSPLFPVTWAALIAKIGDPV